jgi:branched-chain amino acid transport system permease protein
LAALVLPLIYSDETFLTICIFGFFAGVLAVSFNLIFGFTGQLSLFHAAAFGLSAYVTAILTTTLKWGFWESLVPAVGIVAALACVVGTICFRFKLKEFYFAVVTMAFSELLRLIALNWNDVTNGSLGITVVLKPMIGSTPIAGEVPWYYLALALLIIAYLICSRLLASWIGRALEAIRLNDQLGESLGINVFAYKLLSFVVGSVLAGLAGSFYGVYTGFVEPHYMSITQSLDIIAMVLLGGASSLFGPVVGAFVLIALPHMIELSAELRIILYGAILIFVILVMPKGLTGLFNKRQGGNHAS